MHRVLIIGCGAIAGGYDAQRPADAPPLTHAGAFALDARFELAMCIDPDEATRSAFAERWGIARNATSLDELEARVGDFDVVSICSPTRFHAEHLAAALALEPRLVFCEKPVSDNLADAERLVAACESAGVALAVNYTRRWAPDLVRFAQELSAGEWGKVLSATGHYGKGVVHNGGHMVDLLHMLLGPLRSVAAGAPVFDYWAHDPSVPALLATESGATVHLAAIDCRALTRFELELTTEHGTFAMRDGGLRIERRRAGASRSFTGYRTLAEPEQTPGLYEEAMGLAVANIAEHLDRAKPLASTGHNALAAQRLCESLRTISRTALEDTPQP